MAGGKAPVSYRTAYFIMGLGFGFGMALAMDVWIDDRLQLGFEASCAETK
jgi:hypothetical protein